MSVSGIKEENGSVNLGEEFYSYEFDKNASQIGFRLVENAELIVVKLILDGGDFWLRVGDIVNIMEYKQIIWFFINKWLFEWNK